jgi:hypothetical protein
MLNERTAWEKTMRYRIISKSVRLPSSVWKNEEMKDKVDDRELGTDSSAMTCQLTDTATKDVCRSMVKCLTFVTNALSYDGQSRTVDLACNALMSLSRTYRDTVRSVGYEKCVYTNICHMCQSAKGSIIHTIASAIYYIAKLVCVSENVSIFVFSGNFTMNEFQLISNSICIHVREVLAA